MQRSKVRIKNPQKHTVEIYTNDYAYIDVMRTFPLGKISVGDAVKELVRTHKFCIDNKIDTKVKEV